MSVLCVSPHPEDHQRLSSIFSQSNWQLHHANDCGDAIDFMQSRSVPVVISERDLCACGWKNILATLAQLPRWPAPRLIVASHLADDALWAEVLNLGGYDVLEKPFDAREVFWSVSHAWLDWKSEQERAGRKSTAAAATGAAAAD